MSTSAWEISAVSVVTVGSLGSRPWSKKNSAYCNNMQRTCGVDGYVSQSCPPLSVVSASMSVRVWLNRCTNLFIWGWYVVVVTFFPITAHISSPSWLGRQAHNLKVTGTEPHANWWLASLAARLWSRPSCQGLQAPLATWWSSPCTHYCVAFVWEKELEDINSDPIIWSPTGIGVKSGLTDHPVSLLAHARHPLVQHAILFLILAHK